MSTSVYNGDRPSPGQSVVDTPVPRGQLFRRISWSAIFGGVVVAVAVQLLLGLLGAGIGLSTIDVQNGSTPQASNLGIGAGAWWIVSSCIALGVGGFVAAWLAGVEGRFDGMLHGLVTWGLVTLVTVYLLTSAVGGIIGGGFSALGSLASAAGSGISEAAKPLAQATGINPDMLQQQAEAYLQPPNPDPANMSPQEAQKAVATNLVTYAQGGPDAQAAKDRIINIIAAKGDISQQEATQRFNQAQERLQQTRQQAEQKATEAADASAAAVSKSAFAAFGLFLLGAIVSCIGGAFGFHRRRYVAQRVVQ